MHDYADEGLFYVRTWVRGSDTPHEDKFTSRKDAEKCFGEWSCDRAYSRIELLVCIEWMTRNVTREDDLSHFAVRTHSSTTT